MIFLSVILMGRVMQNLFCSWLYKTLFIKHSKLSADNNKTVD